MEVVRGAMVGIAIMCIVGAVIGISYGLLLVWSSDRDGVAAFAVGVVVLALGLLLFKVARVPDL